MDILQVRELKQSLERRDARIIELEQQLESARQPKERGEAVFYYRPRSDGLYEGPIHHSVIEPVRRNSKQWIPLYAHPAPAAGRVSFLTERVAELEASSILEACIRDKMGEILNEVANILKGIRDDDEKHQWHDLPEAAADVVAERETYRKAFENMAARIATLESAPVSGMRRESFEAWVVKCRFFKKLNAHLKQNADGSYGCYAVNDRWVAWQAALTERDVRIAALEAQLAASREREARLRELLEDMRYELHQYTEGFDVIWGRVDDALAAEKGEKE